MTFIDLRKLTIPQLRAMRNALVGTVATAHKKQELKEENAALKTEFHRKQVVEDAGLEWDKDYFMSFSDEHFTHTVRMLQAQKAKAAVAEMNTMKVPQMNFNNTIPGYLSSVELVRHELKNHKRERGWG